MWTQQVFGADKSPVAVISETEYRFTSIMEGNKIIHDFIMQNKGDAPLFIKKVRTGWGCTDVSYPGQIPPGGEGKISVAIDTRNEGGRKISKQILVQTNDTKNSRYKLILSGFVEKFAAIDPPLIKLKGKAGQSIENTVTITPGEKYPFHIVDISARKGENIHFSIKKTDSENPDKYILVVKNIKPGKGRYVDKIYLKTDSAIRPVIEVTVVAIISWTGSVNLVHVIFDYLNVFILW